MEAVEEKAQLSPALLEALAVGSLPDVAWQQEDDLCDCTFQRIGWWTNPYIAETLEVRMCCIWAELYKHFPDFVRTIPAFYDYNAEEWVTQPRDWDSDSEMPKAIWYRHLASKQGRPVAEVRAEYADKDELRPKGYGKAPFLVKIAGDWRSINLASRRKAE